MHECVDEERNLCGALECKVNLFSYCFVALPIVDGVFFFPFLKSVDESEQTL